MKQPKAGMEQQRWAKKREDQESADTLKSLTKDFCSYTSAHGFERIMSSKQWIRKAFWSLLFIAAIVVLCLQILTLLEKYRSRPLVTLVSLQSDTSLPFPTITLCNFNAIKYDALDESNFTDLKETIKKQNSSSNSTSSRKRRATADVVPTDSPPIPRDSSSGYGDEYNENEDYDYWGDDEVGDPNYLDEEYFESEKVSLLLAGKEENYLSKLGHQFKDMILSCTYRGVSCSNFTANFWTKFWHYKYGNCYLFNSGLTSSGSNGPVVKSNKAGPTHGLNLEVNVEQDNYLDKFTPEAGVRLDISSQGYMPFPMEKGLSIPVGFATSIGLRKVMIERQDPFNDNRCHKNSSIDKSNLYTRMFNASYSSTACKESCLANNQFLQCGCMEYRFPVDKNPVCDITNKTTISCLNKLQKQYRDNKLNCSSSCPPPCSQEEFKISTSLAVWPSVFFQDELIKRGKFDWLDFGSLRRNVLKIQIFFEELNVEMIKEQKSYGIADFASDIGGQLGLWIGFSVLTIAEFIEFIMLLFAHLAQKRTSRSKVKSTTMEMN
ncbi:degenerin mec-4-like isoform X2 [Stylophora pistillata]|uniref:Amiloride-sensitive sodium channel subunit alpha n=1 Tax=Stylophora pistillata TaxID=50429 RepID=A0A2B4T074_STYPI|nr:degenerin mec-4-like isoform X2 [Stylophora pistillata]PFX34956.1 Amiloride-sensitive sodium channel subunit alpha [Stylophora pistillata]